MITENYVSFETAQLLKNKGFDWCCGNSYLNEKGVILFPKPTLQMAMKWLREVYKIHIVIEPLVAGNYVIYIYHNSYNECLGSSITYEEATEAGIKYALENLI